MDQLRHRIKILTAFAAIALAALGLTGPASAQSFPTKPVRLIVPYGPGTVSDTTARAAAQWLSEM